MKICRNKAHIVGFECSPEGIKPDTSQVAKVINWQAPTTTKEVSQFLGLCKTVRNWIQGYAELAKPLAELCYRNTEFEWTKCREDTFNKLK